MARTFKLTEVQLILLATDCQRDDGSIIPSPATLDDKMARVRKSITGLINRGLATEIDAGHETRSWREEGDRHIGVFITDAGRATIELGDLPDDAPTTESHALPAGTVPSPQVSIEPELCTPDITAAPATPLGTKQALVVDLLRSDAGASLTELAGVTGWLPHTTRAALTGLRKRGFAIATEKAEGLTRYRIGSSRS